MAVAQELEIKIENLARLEVELPNGRARTINLQADLAGVTILDETYNASPEAVLASLDMLAQQPGRRFAVIGTMLELGEQSVNLHRMVAERAAALAIDGLFIFADDAEAEALIEGAAQQAELCRIAALVGRIVGRVRLRAVRARTVVATPDEDQAVNRVERLIDETFHLG